MLTQIVDISDFDESTKRTAETLSFYEDFSTNTKIVL